MTAPPFFRPPAPTPRSRLTTLLKLAVLRERNILQMLPKQAYTLHMSSVSFGKRPIYIVNHPETIREIMVKKVANYPKSDLMVGALKPLVGDGIFISGGEKWVRQRRMIDPAFAHMRIRAAFQAMIEATDDFENHFDELSASGAPVSIEEEMSHLTADIVFRTMFSQPIESEAARSVFRAFATYQNSVAQVETRHILHSRPWQDIAQPPEVLKMCDHIRESFGGLIDKRLEDRDTDFNDIVADLITAKDNESGESFSREELIDQIAVFFLAGHETTASVLTWALFILSQQPHIVRRMREEVDRVAGDGPVTFEHTRAMTLVRDVFRETMRLYPPVSFITRIANDDDKLRSYNIAKGTMMVISPWLIHRHKHFWKNPEYFDPDRFSAEREKEIMPGSYLPFGLGPRVCTGASFATAESTLILARLIRRYDFETLSPERVHPTAKLTTRPVKSIYCRISRK